MQASYAATAPRSLSCCCCCWCNPCSLTPQTAPPSQFLTIIAALRLFIMTTPIVSLPFLNHSYTSNLTLFSVTATVGLASWQKATTHECTAHVIHHVEVHMQHAWHVHSAGVLEIMKQEGQLCNLPRIAITLIGIFLTPEHSEQRG